MTPSLAALVAAMEKSNGLRHDGQGHGSAGREELLQALLLAVVVALGDEEAAREKRDLRRRRAPAFREAGRRRVAAAQLALPLAGPRAA